MQAKSEEWNVKLAGKTLIKKGETTALSEGEVCFFF
jgi:hypothetical protein